MTHAKCAALGLAGVLLLGSCSGTPPLPEGLGGHTALEAWREGTHLYLKYTGPDGLVYSSTGRPEEVSKTTDVTLVVLTPATTGREPWHGRGETAQRIPVLHASDYRRFRSDSDRLAGSPGGLRRYKVIEGKKRDEIFVIFSVAAADDLRAELTWTKRLNPAAPYKVIKDWLTPYLD